MPTCHMARQAGCGPIQAVDPFLNHASPGNEDMPVLGLAALIWFNAGNLARMISIYTLPPNKELMEDDAGH